MSLANAIMGTLKGIPNAVHLDEGVSDQDLSEIVRTLSIVRGELADLRHARRQLEWERAGHALQPDWGQLYAESDDEHFGGGAA